MGAPAYRFASVPAGVTGAAWPGMRRWPGSWPRGVTYCRNSPGSSACRTSRSAAPAGTAADRGGPHRGSGTGSQGGAADQHLTSRSRRQQRLAGSARRDRQCAVGPAGNDHGQHAGTCGERDSRGVHRHRWRTQRRAPEIQRVRRGARHAGHAQRRRQCCRPPVPSHGQTTRCSCRSSAGARRHVACPLGREPTRQRFPEPSAARRSTRQPRSPVQRASGSTIFQKESLRLILPSVNSNRSHPRTSMDSPVGWVPRIVHSDTPRSPHVQWRS